MVDLSMRGVSGLDGFELGNRFLTREISLIDLDIALLMEVVRLEKDTSDGLLKVRGGSGGRSGALMSRNNG